MSSEHSRLKQKITERVKSMVFLCMFCDSETPMAVSAVDFRFEKNEAQAVAFFICPDCKNKFFVKIQDLGKVGN